MYVCLVIDRKIFVVCANADEVADGVADICTHCIGCFPAHGNENVYRYISNAVLNRYCQFNVFR